MHPFCLPSGALGQPKPSHRPHVHCVCMPWRRFRMNRLHLRLELQVEDGAADSAPSRHVRSSRQAPSLFAFARCAPQVPRRISHGGRRRGQRPPSRLPDGGFTAQERGQPSARIAATRQRVRDMFSHAYRCCRRSICVHIATCWSITTHGRVRGCLKRLSLMSITCAQAGIANCAPITAVCQQRLAAHASGRRGNAWRW